MLEQSSTSNHHNYSLANPELIFSPAGLIKMSIKDKILSTSLFIGEILSNISRAQLNQIPEDLPIVKQVLSTLKAKFDALNSERQLTCINQSSTEDYIDFLFPYLDNLSKQAVAWSGNFEDEQEEELKIILSKLTSLAEFLDFAPIVPVDDLFSIQKTDPRWDRLNQVTTFFHMNKKESVKKSYKNFMGRVASGQAFVSKGYEEAPGKKRLLMIGLGAMYYTFRKKKALRKTQMLYAEPRIEVAQHVWNLLETKMLRKLMKFVIKSIKFNQVIYLPRTSTHVLEDASKLSVDPTFSVTEKENTVMVRLLSRVPLPAFSKKKSDSISKKLILHIHGGGFISMSSASHQVYTNIWAREVGVPIISVDYRLAPKHPYPAALDDVWQAWNWAMDHCETQLGFSPEDYVIVGDSAGGNLTLALAYKILKSRLKPPSGLVLAYPALNLNKNSFSPSLMHALEDLLVPHTFLKLCLDAYLNENSNVKDPMISPSFIEKEVLERLPMTRILIGTEDPLHDECFRFTEKMIECGRDVKVAVFEGASHGGLSYSFRGGIKETKDMVMVAAGWMKEMLRVV